MIAAIYARKSTAQNGITDEEKSVTRQIEHARAYAVKKGWTVAEEHVYADDGISGAEFVKRPGFLRLMNALKPRPPFQALIMSEESRLGREQIETAYALKQIKCSSNMERNPFRVCQHSDSLRLVRSHRALEFWRLRSMRRCEVAFEQRRSIADVVREAISQYIAKRPAKRGNQRLVRGRR